eukprot:RCo037911
MQQEMEDLDLSQPEVRVLTSSARDGLALDDISSRFPHVLKTDQELERLVSALSQAPDTCHLRDWQLFQLASAMSVTECDATIVGIDEADGGPVSIRSKRTKIYLVDKSVLQKIEACRTPEPPLPEAPSQEDTNIRSDSRASFSSSVTPVHSPSNPIMVTPLSRRKSTPAEEDTNVLSRGSVLSNSTSSRPSQSPYSAAKPGAGFSRPSSASSSSDSEPPVGAQRAVPPSSSSPHAAASPKRATAAAVMPSPKPTQLAPIFPSPPLASGTVGAPGASSSTYSAKQPVVPRPERPDPSRPSPAAVPRRIPGPTPSDLLPTSSSGLPPSVVVSAPSPVLAEAAKASSPSRASASSTSARTGAPVPVGSPPQPTASGSHYPFVLRTASSAKPEGCSGVCVRCGAAPAEWVPSSSVATAKSSEPPPRASSAAPAAAASPKATGSKRPSGNDTDLPGVSPIAPATQLLEPIQEILRLTPRAEYPVHLVDSPGSPYEGLEFDPELHGQMMDSLDAELNHELELYRSGVPLGMIEMRRSQLECPSRRPVTTANTAAARPPAGYTGASGPPQRRAGGDSGGRGPAHVPRHQAADVHARPGLR